MIDDFQLGFSISSSQMPDDLQAIPKGKVTRNPMQSPYCSMQTLAEASRREEIVIEI